MNLNNDSFLSRAVSTYGPYFSQGQLSPSMLPPVTGQQARPFSSVHDGYVPREQNAYPSPGIPRPPPYQSPLRREATANTLHDSFHSHARSPPSGTTQIGSREHTAPNEQGLERSNDGEVLAATPDIARSQQANERQSGQIINGQEDNVTPKKKVCPEALQRPDHSTDSS